MSARWLAALLVGTALCAAGIARGQDAGQSRVQDELAVTDQRIQTAQTLVTENPNPRAQSELNLAGQLQARARRAYAVNELMIALSTTMDARIHADQAIAIVHGFPDPTRVQVQVERTRDILDSARDPLDACDNPRALAMLRVAMDMQQRAEHARDESRYLAALQLTMSARERVLKAQRLCNLEESLADAAARALQRTDDVIARAMDTVESGSSTVRVELGRAQDIQAQAEAEMQAGHHEAALRLTLSARVMAQRVLRSAPGRHAAPRG